MKKTQTKIFKRISKSHHFERFLAKKYTTSKRFGLEGCESLIPGVEAIINVSADLGVHGTVIGMPHRGRLNVLANIVAKPYEEIFCEFDPSSNTAYSEFFNEVEGSGDVKYHLGANHDRLAGANVDKPMHITLMANPSHLEAVDPVVIGKTFAKQVAENDIDKSKNMAILLHGDAAFAGQGVNFETFGLTSLKNYGTGGTIHIVANNQIGFTTDPENSRSSPYCTDLAKTTNAPIFHVNGDDVEAVHKVCKLAAEFRSTFQKDVVIDIVCYRKHGHNEIDEPSFTQPFMYQAIKKQAATLDIYSKYLMDHGYFTQHEIDELNNETLNYLEQSFTRAKTYEATHLDWLDSEWKGLVSSNDVSKPQTTGIDITLLQEIGSKLTALPADFSIHRRLSGIMKKEESILSGHDIDWATAEALSFASLLNEGTHVRLSGQDVERGTFSHRHAVLHDQKKNIHLIYH